MTEVAKPQPFLDQNFYRRYRRYYTYIEPMVTSPVVRGYFTLVASMLLVAFFLIFALSPTINTISGLIKKIDDQKAVLAKMDSKIESLVTAQANYSEVEDKLPLLTVAVTERPEPEGILADILKVASSSGVKIQGVRMKDLNLASESARLSAAGSGVKVPYQGLGVPMVEYGVSVSGPDLAVRHFLETLEGLPRVMRSESVVFGGGGQGLSGSSVEVQATAFYYAER